MLFSYTNFFGYIRFRPPGSIEIFGCIRFRPPPPPGSSFATGNIYDFILKILFRHLIGCSFNGPLPPTLGSLSQLISLSLNCNGFAGPIPPSIGNLSKLFVLDLADNKLSGSIPVSDEATPGLDLLFNTRHLLFEDNQLTGTIPSTLWLAQKLEVLRLDRNLLSGKIPSSINNLKLLKQLYLSNNKLDGPLPNLTSMTFLNYLDISNNSFEPSEIPPWFSSLQSLTTLMMHDTGLQGEVPVDLFHIPQIETVVLRNNQLDGTLDFGESYSESLRLIDVSNNSISAFTQRIHSADQPDLMYAFLDGNHYISFSFPNK
ncbi:putative non-specific serine/threonine protein kinase [Helianthus annuus]|nr:putative non-specific serine/threonine protein kinase [Helianthus annuus]